MPTLSQQLAELPELARTFWEEKQQELGDTLRKFSYAVFVDPAHYPFAEKSGILYLMERNLWFEDFQKPPFFLINKAPVYKKIRIQIPCHSIQHTELMTQSILEDQVQGTSRATGFWTDLFQFLQRDSMCIRVRGTDESGEDFHYAFKELEDPEDWLQELQTRL